MFHIFVGQGGASIWLNSWFHFFVRATRLGNPLRKSLGLLAMAGVWRFLGVFARPIVYAVVLGHVSCPSMVCPNIFQGVCPPLEVWRGLDGQVWGLVCLWIGHVLDFPASGTWL